MDCNSLGSVDMVEETNGAMRKCVVDADHEYKKCGPMCQ